MILAGLTLTFFGSKFIEVTVCLGCIIMVLCAAFILVFDIFFKNDPPGETTIWIVGAASVMLGLILGYIFNKMVKIFFTIFGAYLGYVVGIILYQLFINKINMDQKTLYWITIGVCALIFVILSFIMFEYIVIFSTALIGSYIAVRVCSILI